MGRLGTLLALGTAALGLAGPAAAGGGTSIANAPWARSGAEQSGDTATDTTADGSIGSEESPGCWNDVEYWRLALVAGDRVLVRGTAQSPSHHFGVGLFPAGTTDRNIARAVAVTAPFPSRGAIRFAARASGTYVLVFGPTCYNGVDGPYTFAVTVTHRAAS